MPNPLPSPEFLRKLLRYEESTGFLYWRPRTADMFKSGAYGAVRSCAAWNGRYAGKRAFTTCSRGYMQGSILDKLYRAPRVIWAMENGVWPVGEIDHEDRCRSNDRISNLRDVSGLENSKNRGLPAKNKSGVVGVHWSKRDLRWQAYIHNSTKRVHLGNFTNKSDAIDARASAEVKYGFHPNHGRQNTPSNPLTD